MRKGSKVFIIIIIVILLLGGVFVFLYSQKEKSKLNYENSIENDYLDQEDINWQAKYIWYQREKNLYDSNLANTWVYFRKSINITSNENIQNVVARIAADSKYWLYINGELVLREGELKRGEKPNSIYYDEVNIDKHLKEGENTIAILVWYFGKDGFSHVSSGNGALLFQSQIGNDTIISDSSWKTIKSPSYLKDIPVINGRLSEENIYYDASKELEEWYSNSFDDSLWNDAVEIGNANELPWGVLIKRKIPFFEFSEIKEYENLGEYKGKILDKDTLLELKLPYNMQLVPYLNIEAKEGKKIFITLDEEYNSLGKENKTTYITKEGSQEFESPAWINAEKIYYYIPKGTKIISLGYRQTGYKIDNIGKFSCNDEFYNTLWEKSYNTLRINMRDSYMDCPDRERAEWWADASIEMEQAIYSLDKQANKLYRKAINTLIGWKHDDILLTINPSKSASMHLPIQMCLSIEGMYEYYLYTGEKDFLEQIYPHVKNYLLSWHIREDGFVSFENGYALWKWEDSSGNSDYLAAENAWYYYALSKVYNMAIILEKNEDIPYLQERLYIIDEAFNENWWDGNGYKEWSVDKYDIRVNAIAVLSGLATEMQYDKISEILVSDNYDSPLMEKYVIEALCKMGKIERAQARMKKQYKKMVECENTTLGEYWDETRGSKNHGWSGGPIIIMSKYFAGITPSNPGFTEINVKPQFGFLKNINSKINTVSGSFEINASKSMNEIKIEMITPVRTRVALEKKNNNPQIFIDEKCVYKDGKNKINFKGKYETEDDKYIYYIVESGKHVLESR